jgi:hypothetical protein
MSSSNASASEDPNSSRHAYDDEIPTKQNIEQTQKMIKKQDNVPGLKRDNVIADFPEAAAMGRILINVGFPADKNKLIKFVQEEQESKPQCRFDCKEILPLLQKLEERFYESAGEVTKAAGLVRHRW